MPRTARSAGTWATPACRMRRTDELVTTAPSTMTSPATGLRRPARHSVSSTCPEPSTPATPRTSPPCTVKETPSTANPPRSLAIERSRASRRTSPEIFRRRPAGVERPSGELADHQRREPAPVHVGPRQRGDEPATPQDREAVGDPQHLVELVADEEDAHPGPREAAQDRGELVRLLGREHRRRLVEGPDRVCRASAFNSSARCCRPTLRSSTRASGSTSIPCWRDRSRTRLAARRTDVPDGSPRSARTRFSATVSVGMSEKCCWT